jgi:CRISPR-associated endonuclease/helicase Cas3
MFFIAVHDIGKLDIRFQLKASDAIRLSWPELDTGDAEPEPAYDHGSYGMRWASGECVDWVSRSAQGYDVVDAWRPWLAAVTGHHGVLPQAHRPQQPDCEPYIAEHDRAARAAFAAEMAALILEPAGSSISALPPALDDAARDLLAGFCSVCDWIASNEAVSPYLGGAGTPNCKGYLDERAQDIADRGWLVMLGLIRSPLSYGGIPKLLREGEAPRGVQVVVDEIERGPGLTLIEAPTGSGKTEAALALAWRLLASGAADSIVFALPTQATANAMLERAERFAATAFGADANVVLAHGKRDLTAAFRKLVESGHGRTVQGADEAAAQCAAWLAQSRKRVFLGQIGVCTVDQALLSVLPVRHKFVRGFGLAKSVLIVDEVHAYDSYMHGLLAEVLRRQRAAGGSAILLSATLPATLREKLFASWGASAEPSPPYPALWQVRDERASAREVPADQQPERREVALETLSLADAMPDDALIERIVGAAERGARVAVIANLVDIAQGLARRLRARSAVPVNLFHSRYRFGDRQTIEQSVLREYGREAARDGGRILVATQVIEQSLDLDFDWMVTQLCPVDLLFQRLGRLHRHPRQRPPGFGEPHCIVLTSPGEDYGKHAVIYPNVRVLWRTQRLLAGCQCLVFPGAYREWIEAAYGEMFAEDEPDRITKDYQAFEGKQYAAEYDAKQMIAVQRAAFADGDTRILVKTRDGEMSLSVLPCLPDGRLLDGTSLDTLDDRDLAEALDRQTVPVPATWMSVLKSCPADDEQRFRIALAPADGGGWTGRLGQTAFRYSEEFGMEKHNDGPA